MGQGARFILGGGKHAMEENWHALLISILRGCFPETAFIISGIL